MRWLPVVVYLFLMAGLFIVLGIMPAGDTHFYLTGANKLLQGMPLSGDENLYAGYISFIATHLIAGLPLSAVIISQILISAAGVVAISDCARRLAGPAAGLLAGSIYALNIDLHRFAFYILSDSVMISAIILLVYCVYRAITSTLNRWVVLTILSGLAVAFLRVNGWLFAGAIWLFLALSRPGWSRKVRVMSIVLMGSVFLTGISHTMHASGKKSGITGLMVQGRVIWGDAESAIPMPPRQTEGQDGLVATVGYCASAPIACASLGGRRIFTELIHTRSFHSFKHNLAVWMTFPLCYMLAILGLWRFRRQALPKLIIGIISIQLGMVALTGADWDGRFILTIMPLVMLFASIGAIFVFRTLSRYQLWSRWSSPREVSA